MHKKVSQKDIAKKAGVSTALVSYVLNNKKEGRISREVAQKIRQIAREMNYRPNQIAKSLKTSRTNTIGLIVSNISNPFSSTLARIIEDEADGIHYTVLFGSSDENEKKFSKLFDTLMDRQVDGLIIAPPANAEPLIRQIQEQQIPFVLIDRYFPSLQTNYVILDNFHSAALAVQHLIDHGYQKPGMIGLESSLFHLKDRINGYKAALRKNSIEFQKKWLVEVSLNTQKKEVETAIENMLKGSQKVDALLFGSNSIASVGLKYINSLPIRVPENLGIVSFDETEGLDLFYAPLTYIRQPLPEMGRMAVKILMENIAQLQPVQEVVMEGKLVVRESSRRK